MIDKEKLPEFIDRYNNKKLHGKDLEEFLELLKNDPGLRLEVKIDKELNEILSEPDIIDLRRKIIKNRIPERSDRPGLSFLLFAASVAFIIGLAVFVFFWLRRIDNESLNSEIKFNMADTTDLSRNKPEDLRGITFNNETSDSIMDRERKSGFIEEDELLFADNFSPFLPYESLAGETSRTGYFRLLKPPAESNYKKGSLMTFSWEAVAKGEFTLIITNNKGKDVFASPPVTGASFDLETSELEQGLYYFKFILNDELVYLGKFTIR